MRAYEANLQHYDRLGSEFRRFIRAVIADESWHYARFLETAVSEHPHRLRDAPAVVARVRASEGVTYAGTLVLDHDDPVFTQAIFDQAQLILERQLRRAAEGIERSRDPRRHAFRGPGQGS